MNTISTPEAAARQRSLFLEGMSHAASTVSIVTTAGPAGRFGVTVSAMSSVSADGPAPMLLVCVHQLSPAAQALITNRVFCVNVLRDDQAHISDAFAGRRKMPDGDKFSAAEWVAGTDGVPRIADALVSFDCRLDQHILVGTHLVLFGAVRQTVTLAAGAPLIYARRSYGTPAHFISPPVFDAEANLQGLRIGVYTSFAPYVLPAVLERMRARGLAPPLRILDADQRALAAALRDGAIEVALSYDIALDNSLQTEVLGSLQPHVLLAAGHALAGRDAIHLAELSDEPFMLYDIAPSREYFLSIFSALGLEPRLAWRTSSFELIRGMVGHGLGYSVLGTRPAGDMSYDGRPLVARPIADAGVPPSRIVAAWPDQGRSSKLSAQARQFVEICRDHLAAALPMETLT